MNLNEYLQAAKDLNDPDVYADRTNPLAKRIYCNDGFNLSVQASWSSYCEPRTNHGPWTKVEVGFPSGVPTEIMDYCEDPNAPTETIYGYVPIHLVENLIANHGGVASPESKPEQETNQAQTP